LSQLTQTPVLSQAQELIATSYFATIRVSTSPKFDIPSKSTVQNSSFDRSQSQAYISYNIPTYNYTQSRYLPTIPPLFFASPNDKSAFSGDKPALHVNTDNTSFNCTPSYPTFSHTSQLDLLNPPREIPQRKLEERGSGTRDSSLLDQNVSSQVIYKQDINNTVNVGQNLLTPVIPNQFMPNSVVSSQGGSKLSGSSYTPSQPFSNSSQEERRQFVPFIVAYIPI
jgi:hypothetical protein